MAEFMEISGTLMSSSGSKLVTELVNLPESHPTDSSVSMMSLEVTEPEADAVFDYTDYIPVYMYQEEPIECECDDKKFSMKAFVGLQSYSDIYPETELENHLSYISSIFNKNFYCFLVDSNGLIHHCSQSGITLIIPEGAVQQLTIVRYGACLLSDKFEFGDYVPVTPIVWVHADRELIKPAKLYLPHNIDVDTTEKRQLIHLVASDKNFMKDHYFQFIPSDDKFEVMERLFETSCHHFCSHCIAVDNDAYRKIKKWYSITMAQKDKDTTSHKNIIFHFCLFPSQILCKKLVDQQFKEQEFSVIDTISIKLDGNYITTKFKPNELNGWRRHVESNEEEKITEEEADYFMCMGCPEKFGIEEIERLQYLESIYKYPPRFRYRYIYYCKNNKIQGISQRIFFHGVGKLGEFLISWEPEVNSEELEASPTDTYSDEVSPTNISPDNTDRVLFNILVFLHNNINYFVNGKWFDFGYGLGLSVPFLLEIENKHSSVDQYVRKIVLLWRSKNKESSWKPIAEALTMMKLQTLADQLKIQFEEELSASSQSSQLNGAQCTVDGDRNNSARKFRRISFELSVVIVTSVIKVSMALNAYSMITRDLNNYIVDHQDVNSVKASKLVKELLETLNSFSEDDSKIYLQQVCTILKSLNEKLITDTVETLL